jgi:hypothetical protein
VLPRMLVHLLLRVFFLFLSTLSHVDIIAVCDYGILVGRENAVLFICVIIVSCLIFHFLPKTVIKYTNMILLLRFAPAGAHLSCVLHGGMYDRNVDEVEIYSQSINNHHNSNHNNNERRGIWSLVLRRRLRFKQCCTTTI